MSGYWKTVYIFDEETGRKQSTQVWVNTPDKKSKRTGAKRRATQNAAAAAAQKNARLAARRAREQAVAQAAARAGRIAARIARQQAVAQARREAFENLQRRQAEILRRRGIIRDKTAAQKTASTYIAEREDTQESMRQQRLIQQQNQQKAAAAANRERENQLRQQAEAEARKQLTLRKLNLGRETKRYAGTGRPKEPAPNLEPGDVKEIEAVLENELARADKGQFDTQTVEALRKAYDHYALKVYNDYEDLVVAINSAIDQGKLTTAQSLYEKYTKLVPEFQRLFGTGRDAMKDGAYNKFYETYQQIGQKQREWWKSQMKAQLQATIDKAKETRRITPEVEEAMQLLALLEGRVETRTVDGRQYTLEEELAARQAERIMEQQKMYAARMAQSAAIKAQMLRQGMVEYRGQYIPQAHLPVAHDAEAVIQEFYGGKFEPKDPNDIHQFVDKMVAGWEKAHPKPSADGTLKSGYTIALEDQDWEAAREAYENRAYEFFEMGPQGILEKGMATPGIHHALQILQAPFSALGAGARVANAAIFGESTVGGSKPTLLDAPPSVKAAADKYAQEWLKKTGQEMFGGGGIHATRWDPRAGMEQAKNEYFQNWLKTPEGQKWLTATLDERKQQELQENTDFASKWGQAHPWDQLEALNQFGSSPFQNEGANLLASLLLDPLNVIPLNFTKYISRGKYALESTQGASKVVRPITATKTFLATDEGTLSMWKHFRATDKELAAKGISRDRFLDILRERVAGTKTAAQRNEAVRDVFRELGLDPRKVNEAQLATLSEHLIHAKIKNEKLDFFSQADEIKQKKAAAERVAEQAEAARKKFAKEETDRVAASLRVREAEAKAARSAEGVEYRKAQATLEKRANSQKAGERARQAGAARTVAGPSSPARTPKSPSSAEAIRQKQAPLRQAYSDAIFAVRRGEAPIDPSTGRPLKASEGDAIAYYFEKLGALDDELKAASGPAPLAGGSGAIERKMAAGDVKGSQAANIEEGLARGGTVESGGAMKPDFRPPEVTEPLPSPLDAAPMLNADVLLQKLGQMSEAEWYAAVKAKMGAILASKKSTPAAKTRARRRLAQIKMAELAMEVEKKGGKYVRWQDRANFQKRVLKRYGKDVEGYVAPSLVAPFVQSVRDAAVEQARTYYRLLSKASPELVDGVEGIRIKGKTVDFMPMDVFRELDRRVSASIREARGHAADTVTRARGSRLNLDDPDATDALGRMSDRDPVVLRAKREALKKYADETGNDVSMVAYDEARKVLWKGYVQNRTALRLLALAKKKAAASGGDLEEAYLALRKEMARREARRQFGGMAFGQLYGVNPDVILAEFIARYSDDGTSIRHFAPQLTAFQRKTLEANFTAISGKAFGDPDVKDFLQSANLPPLQNRELTKKFLERIGAWSPRKAEEFVLGARSWSIADEADYWRTAYGEVPEWADVGLLATRYKNIFDDQQLYIDQHKEWGVFNRSHDLALRVDEGVTQAQLEKLHLTGDPTRGIPARRSLELQRRYVIERFGPLVSKDGQTLDAMPWLMTDTELKRYLARRTFEDLPSSAIRTEKELDEAVGLIQKAIDRYWDQYIGVKAADGPIHYHDVFRLASEIQSQLLANPKWARRWRDVFGKGLNGWAWANRWLIFSNPAFMVVNVVDAPIKGAWFRLSRRGLYNRALDGSEYAKKADELTPEMMNWDSSPAMYRTKQMKARERVVKPRGLTDMDRVVDRAMAAVQFTGEAFPEVAGRAELAMRMRLAKGMYPEVYSQALKRWNDPEMAHLVALDFIKKEVDKMWPTAGHGPLEQLWNRLVPFGSYTLRNKVLWISEAINHPVVLVHFERIGRAVEAHNIREWEANPENKGQPMPENLRRLIELPWAKGYYMDLAQLTDASRGLQPLYETRWKSTLDRFDDWIRIINPSMQAGIYALFNAFNIAPRTAWEVGPDGQYREVTVPWAEPWSKDAATLGSVFWFVDALEVGAKYGIDGWSSGEASAMIGQVFFFNAVKTYDRMGVLYGWYKGLSNEDKNKFRQTPEGQAMAEWLASRVNISDFKGDLLAMMAEHDRDPGRFWFTHQPQGWKDRVFEARGKIDAIRKLYADELWQLTPGTEEYRAMKARMYLAISDVYTQYPELMEADVYTKSASEWAAQTAEWQTDKLTDDFFALSDQRPQRGDFKSTVAYNNAVEAWERQKRTFLATYPEVAKRIASEIAEVESVRNQIEKQWDETLGRISKRNEAIEAAKAIIEKFGGSSAKGRAARERLDLLYLQNDLDYSLLERDYAATYFSPEDYEKLPIGRETKDVLRVPDLLKRATIFNDFDRAVYEKHRKAGTLEEYLAKAAYGRSVKDAIMYAKRGDPFGEFDYARYLKYTQDHAEDFAKYFGGDAQKRAEFGQTARYVEGIRAIYKQAGNDPAAFVRLLKKDPWLLKQYFARNPDKEAEWRRMDEYIRSISVWGKLVGAGRWDEANDAWDRLPKWVKDMYHERHPERRGRAQQTAEYMGYMKRWIKLFDSAGDEKAMKYFKSLPKWARERYYAAHPENRMKFENSDRLNTMLREYFAAEKSARGDYLAKHPELKKWLANNSNSKEQQRLAILQAYSTIPKGETWLRKVFREKYPEIFSAEAVGERRLRAVYDTLAKHPGVLPEFEKWVKEIWRTYAEMLKLGVPRPAKLYFERDRDEEKKRREALKSRSAAQTSR